MNEEEEQMEEAVLECVDSQLNKLFWKALRFCGIPMAGMVISMVIFYAQLSYHVEDHHEKILIEMSVDLKHLKDDITEFRKTLGDG
jgi:hypothetical protein